MDEWDEEYVDLVETAHIMIDNRGQGEFLFGAMKGWLDSDSRNATAYRSSSFPGRG